MEFGYTEEQDLMIRTVRDYAQEVIAPLAKEMDESASMPAHVIEGLKEMGLFGAQIPEEYGGLGLDTVTYAGIIEELAKACAGVAIMLSVHTSVAAYPISRFGTEEQKKRFLPRLAEGEIGAFCISEPGSGSDAASVRTSARRDGDEYVIDGTKVFVTNGSIASLYFVLARTDPEARPLHRGTSALLVERGTPGLEVGRKEEKMGLRASDTMEVVFDGARVPAANLLGEEGQGFKIAMATLDNGRIGVAAQALGIAEAAFAEALRYAKERKQFGQPLVHFQAIQWKLSEMATRIEASRMLVRQAAWMKDHGIPFTRQAAMAKLNASETANYVVYQALQIHGGYGYMKEYAVERYFRDARVTEIYEGTSEMQRLVIARSLLRER